MDSTAAASTIREAASCAGSSSSSYRELLSSSLTSARSGLTSRNVVDMAQQMRENRWRFVGACLGISASGYLLWKIAMPCDQDPYWHWDLRTGLQAQKWDVYGRDMLKSGYPILAIVGTWKSGKTHVQRLFGARTKLKNIGLTAVNIESRSACLIESLGVGTPPEDSNVSLDEQELTVRFSIDLVTEIANGVVLVIGDRMSADDLRLLEDMKAKCQARSIPLFVWHNLGISGNQRAVFRRRMKTIYNAEIDNSFVYDAPDSTSHLLGGIRSKPRAEHVFHGLRAAAGCLPSKGTLEEKIESAGSQIIHKYFAGVSMNPEGSIGEMDAESDASEMAFNVRLVYCKDEGESKTKLLSKWLGKGERRNGEFHLATDEYTEPLELRTLHGAMSMSQGWMPRCCVYETAGPNGRIVKNIEMEAPGVLFEDVEVQTTKMGVKVSARKNLPYHDSMRTSVDEDGRCYGLFVRNFVFHDSNAIFQPVPPPEGLSMHNGVLLVRLWKVEMNKKIKKRSPSSIAGSLSGRTTTLRND